MTEEDRPQRQESLLDRWSRVKSESRQTQAIDSKAPAEASDKAPELPPLDTLTIESDFSGFFHPRVDEDVRRTALRKLFSDPHFNTMDGLDVYIDDYSKSEPIPAAMLGALKQAQRILEWARESEDRAGENAADAAAPAAAAARSLTETTPAPIESVSQEPSCEPAAPHLDTGFDKA